MSNYKNNLHFIKNNQKYFKINQFCKDYDLQYVYDNSIENVPSLKVCKNNDNCQQIHSAYTPLKEADVLANHFQTNKSMCLLLELD